MNGRWIPGLLVVFVALGASAPAAGAPPERTVSVNGEGRVSVAPDRATVHAGVVTRAPLARAALAENNRALARVMDVLGQQGVAPADMRTAQISVSPVFARGAQEPGDARIVAYQVSNQLRVRVADIARLGEVLDALVGAGSNELSGISFEVSDQASALDEARRRAMADARHRAQLYAVAAQSRLGRVLSVSEQGISVPRPLARMTMMESAGPVPVAPGEQELEARVTVVFELRE